MADPTGAEKARDGISSEALTRHPDNRDAFTTTSGIELPLVGLPSPVAAEYSRQSGFPGEYPFTRGLQPAMYRSRLWTMRQYAGYGTSEETNQRYRYLLQNGQTGLSVAFDLPTQIGYDPDEEIARGEVGKVGVSVATLANMEALFRDIPLEKVSTSMTINAPAAILLAMYIAVAKRQGADLRQLRGTVQNDILKEYLARGTYIFPPAPSMRLVTDVMAYCAAELPHWNPISISGYHIREAGATAVQEVAFTIANGLAYIESALGAGLSLDEFAPQLSFFFSADNDFLEEVAKFRAARRLWARIMRERLNARNPSSWQMRFHTQTAGSTLTAQQPENNVVRVALQALAAVLGGTQSLHTNSKDEALWLPTEPAVRVALRTQQILAHESGVAATVDPLAGSYLLEHLTDEIERRAEEYLARIAALGGALNAIEHGFLQNEIHEAAYAAQRAVETGHKVVVGVNRYQTRSPISIERLRADPSIEEAQRQHLAQIRARRDPARVANMLGALASSAHGRENLMPTLIECVEQQVTLGEICGTLRSVWGAYRPASF